MYLLEIFFLIVLFTFLIAQNIKGLSRKISLSIFLIGAIIVLLTILMGQFRWQLTLAYLLYAILALTLLKKTSSRIALRSTGVILGIILLIISMTLALALPIVTLPKPDGPYVVGSRTFSLIDKSRDESYFGAPDEFRELYLQIWYPGRIDKAPLSRPVRTLWAELYRGPRDPVTFITGYMQGIKTHTHENIPFLKTGKSYPVIVFSHSLGLTAEQNTPLMEHLASHGYVAIGVSHTHMAFRVISSKGQAIYPDPDKVKEAFEEGAAIDKQEYEVRLTRTHSAEERAEIIYELGERAVVMNEQIAIRVADLRFVMDLISNPSDAPPELSKLLEQTDSNRIGLMGMSLGGATVIDTCKIDTRCRAGLNLDGGIFGQYLRRPLKIPFLSMVSASNRKFDEPLLVNSTSDYYEVLVNGAKHGDFCDMTFLMPFMKWLGANGPIDPWRVTDIVNTVSLSFFDAYLRDGPKPRFDRKVFPELRVTMNDQASK